MTGFNYMGQTADGRRFNFSNDAGASFEAYVSDSLIPMLQGMAPGTRVDGEIQTKTSKTGNTYTQVTALNGQKGTKQGGQQGGGFKPRTYEPKRFVEQVCVAAIGAGLVKDSKTLDAWAKGAYALISTLDTSVIRDQIKPEPSAAPSKPSADPAPNDPIPF